MSSTNNLKLYSALYLKYTDIITHPGKFSQVDLLKTTTDSQKNYINLINELGTTGLYIDNLVPNTGLLTINGVSQNLSEDRTWTIATGGAPSILSDYADDEEAAMNGIDIGEEYHTSGIIKLRLS